MQTMALSARVPEPAKAVPMENACSKNVGAFLLRQDTAGVSTKGFMEWGLLV